MFSAKDCVLEKLYAEFVKTYFFLELIFLQIDLNKNDLESELWTNLATEIIQTPQPLYNTVFGVQANFCVSYSNCVISRVKCVD